MYIQSATAKGYDVLQMEEVIDPHFVNFLEHKIENSAFVRVDSDTTDKLIRKDIGNVSKLNEEQRDSVYTRLWQPVDVNKATPEEMELIPGVGERMRHEFEEYRPYTSMDQFRREIGKYVDDAEVARLEQYVTIRTTQ